MIASLSASDYHRRTSYDRNRMSGHALDWGAQPDVFKTYDVADSLALQAAGWPECRPSVLHAGTIEHDPTAKASAGLLAAVLTLSHGLTAKATYGGVDFYYRSVASAGALYPFELYVGATDVHGLANGLYHHSVAKQTLTQLRCENITDHLMRGINIGDNQAPVLSFFLTTIFFRSSWKYRDRAYRYHLLDTGHLAENLCASLTLSRVPFRLHYDFDDAIINDLLCLDTEREACLAVALAWAEPAAQEAPRASSIVLKDPRSASRVSPREVDYPLIRKIHEASSHVVVSNMTPGRMSGNLGLEPAPGIAIPFPERSPEVMNYAEAVFSRRSIRNFVRRAMPSECFKVLVNMVCGDADSRDRLLDETLAVGILIGDVEGSDPGLYLLDRSGRSLLPVKTGFLMDEMASVCLNQEWLGNCAVHFLFLSNLDLTGGLWGARAYRYAMLSAGRLGQRIYVGATAMHMGCCGIGAFYDDEADRLLGLSEGCNLLYLVATGPVKKWPVGSKK
jgi:SagB-type dehydrogenase family enzyme